MLRFCEAIHLKKIRAEPSSPVLREPAGSRHQFLVMCCRSSQTLYVVQEHERPSAAHFGWNGHCASIDTLLHSNRRGAVRTRPRSAGKGQKDTCRGRTRQNALSQRMLEASSSVMGGFSMVSERMTLATHSLLPSVRTS